MNESKNMPTQTKIKKDNTIYIKNLFDTINKEITFSHHLNNNKLDNLTLIDELKISKKTQIFIKK